jgi:hypothetical protein
MFANFPHLKPYKKGNLEILAYDDGVVLLIDGFQWMSYEPTKEVTFNQLKAEIELGYGHCVTTGLGLGLKEISLAKKESVTKITIFEYSQEVVDWFKQATAEANIDISKMEFIVGDANKVSNIKCDCLFPNHFVQESADKNVIETANFVKNHEFKVLWFFPMFDSYANWVRKHKKPINSVTLKEWAVLFRLENMLPNVDDEFIKRNIRIYFRLDK